MERKIVADHLQKALDFAIDEYGEQACRNGLCFAVNQMRSRGYLTKEEHQALLGVIDELMWEWGRRCGCPGGFLVYLWSGIVIQQNLLLPRTSEVFPLWRQAYEDKIEELKTGVHHG